MRARRCLWSLCATVFARLLVAWWRGPRRQGFRRIRDARPISVRPCLCSEKTSQRRCRRSSMDVMQALQVADSAGHAEAIVRSSGSNWLASASARVRCHLYRQKSGELFVQASAAHLCWDGLSVTGLNVQLGCAHELESGKACYLTPKAIQDYQYLYVRFSVLKLCDFAVSRFSRSICCCRVVARSYVYFIYCVCSGYASCCRPRFEPQQRFLSPAAFGTIRICSKKTCGSTRGGSGRRGLYPFRCISSKC